MNYAIIEKSNLQAELENLFLLKSSLLGGWWEIVMKRVALALAIMFLFFAVGGESFAAVTRFFLNDRGAQALFNYGDFFTGGTLFGDTQVLVESGVEHVDKNNTRFIVLFFFTHETTLCCTFTDVIDVNETVEIPASEFHVNVNSARLKAQFVVFDFVSQRILPASVDLVWHRSGDVEVTNEHEHFSSNGVETIIKFKAKSAPADVSGTVTFNSENVATINNGGTLFDFINGEIDVIK
jgi:hypothetical protein